MTSNKILRLSRLFEARLFERGDQPSQFLPGSRHRRTRLEDVLTFRAGRERTAEGAGGIPHSEVSDPFHPREIGPCPAGRRLSHVRR